MKQLLVLFLACILLFCVIRTDANCGGKACCRSKQAKEVPKSAITYEVYEDAPNCNRAFNDIQLAIDTAVTEVQPTKTKFVNILNLRDAFGYRFLDWSRRNRCNHRARLCVHRRNRITSAYTCLCSV